VTNARGVVKVDDFRQTSRYISEIVQDSDYYGMVIWTRVRSIEWHYLEWSWVTSNCPSQPHFVHLCHLSYLHNRWRRRLQICHRGYDHVKSQPTDTKNTPESTIDWWKNLSIGSQYNGETYTWIEKCTWLCCQFNCHIEIEGLLKVTGSYVVCKLIIVSSSLNVIDRLWYSRICAEKGPKVQPTKSDGGGCVRRHVTSLIWGNLYNFLFSSSLGRAATYSSTPKVSIHPLAERHTIS